MDYADSPNGNETLIYQNVDTVVSGNYSFDVIYEAACASLFWILFIVYGALGLHHVRTGEWRNLMRWPLYIMMMSYIVATCLSESLALTYSVEARSGAAPISLYAAYIFFWHASSASFLVLLLALSSGYTITRNHLQGHERVYIVPAVVFLAGVASDWTFAYVQNSQQLSAAADRYSIVEMTPFESVVWVVGSLANIMCFILSWIFIFDSTQLEIKTLDDEQKALHRTAELDAHPRSTARGNRIDDDDFDQPQDEEDDAPINPHQQGRARPGAATNGHQRGLGRNSQRQGLLNGVQASSQAGGDVESGDVKETVADHVQYTVKKTLLRRFWYGVCAYLLVSVMVIILPAFFNVTAQNVIVVLQFIVKLLFTVVLAWIFRPARDSPYLQIGLSEKDADDLGVSGLDTELAVTEYTGSRPEQRNQTAPAGPTVTQSTVRAGAAAPAAPARLAAGRTERPASVAAMPLPLSRPADGPAPRQQSAPATQPPFPRRPRSKFSAASKGDQENGPKFTLDEHE